MDADLRRRRQWFGEHMARLAPRVGAKRIYASGTRNPTNLAIDPETGRLFAVVNERDEIGPDLVPDYLTMVQEGAFYGWPYSYWGGDHVDVRVHPQRPDLVATAVKPDYGLSSHVAACIQPKARSSHPNLATACSSVSTAVGTAARLTAIK